MVLQLIYWIEKYIILISVCFEMCVVSHYIFILNTLFIVVIVENLD
jgi:hypothetical protein